VTWACPMTTSWQTHLNARSSRNLPAYLQSLPAEVKRDARYLSKFVIGAGSGLFDYALNAICNEVVIDLRKKASFYGLDISFDAAVGGGKTREFYKTEDDLAALKDACSWTHAANWS
jgi:hypothetical protein